MAQILTRLQVQNTLINVLNALMINVKSNENLTIDNVVKRIFA